MIVDFFERESKSFSWSLRTWTWKAWQAQVALSFKYPGQGRAGSSRKGTLQGHHIHEQQQRVLGKEHLASWTAKGEKQKNHRDPRAGELNQEQECVPKERGGSRQPGTAGVPCKKQAGPACGAGDRNVLQGQRAAQAHPALRTPQRTEWKTLFMAGNFSCYKIITPKERQG